MKGIIIAALAFGAGWYLGANAKRAQLLSAALAAGADPYKLGVSEVKR